MIKKAVISINKEKLIKILMPFEKTIFRRIKALRKIYDRACRPLEY